MKTGVRCGAFECESRVPVNVLCRVCADVPPKVYTPEYVYTNAYAASGGKTHGVLEVALHSEEREIGCRVPSIRLFPVPHII